MGVIIYNFRLLFVFSRKQCWIILPTGVNSHESVVSSKINHFSLTNSFFFISSLSMMMDTVGPTWLMVISTWQIIQKAYPSPLKLNTRNGNCSLKDIWKLLGLQVMITTNSGTKSCHEQRKTGELWPPQEIRQGQGKMESPRKCGRVGQNASNISIQSNINIHLLSARFNTP